MKRRDLDRIEGLLFLILAQTADSPELGLFWFVAAFLCLFGVFSWVERRAEARSLRRTIRREIERRRESPSLYPQEKPRD